MAGEDAAAAESVMIQPSGREMFVPLDPRCPCCGGAHDVGEAFDGSERRCYSCGAPLVCVSYGDFAQMEAIDRRPWKLTGRAATRARWRRRGRR